MKKLEILECHDSKHAIVCIFAGFLFFLMKKTIPTIVICLALLGGPAVLAWKYVENKVMVKIEEAKPVTTEAKPIGALEFDFDLFSKAYASEWCFDSIIINKLYYGCWDKTLKFCAVKNTNRVIVYDEDTKKVYDIEIPYFKEQRSKIRQMK